jgi:hypothetical protein
MNTKPAKRPLPKRVLAAVAISIVAPLFGCGAARADDSTRNVAAPPEIAGISPMVGHQEPLLVYGAGFGAAGAAALEWAPPQPAGQAWSPEASLRRVLAGKVAAPLAPPADAAHLAVEKQDEFTLFLPEACTGQGGSYAVHVLWVNTPAGIARPYRVNVPEVWLASPRRLVAGQKARVFGLNLAVVGGQSVPAVCLRRDERVVSCPTFFTRRPMYHRYQHPHEVGFDVPGELVPGVWDVYVHNGSGGDLGWSRAFPAEVIAAPARLDRTVNIRAFGAAGDGSRDDSGAIQRAMADVARQGGGSVFVPAGRYRVSRVLVPPPGVTLRGVSAEASVIAAAEGFQDAFADGGAGGPLNPVPALHEKLPVVWLQTGCAVEDLTVDATASPAWYAVLVDRGLGSAICRDVALRRCRILNEGIPWVAAGENFKSRGQGILVASSTDDLVVDACQVRSTEPYTEAPGVHRGTLMRHNVFEDADPGRSNLVVFRGHRECVIEHNTIRNGMRGLYSQGHPVGTSSVHNYVAHNLIEGIHGAENACETLTYEMGQARFFGPAAGADAESITARNPVWWETGKPWKPGQWKGYAVVVTEGRGIGQLRWAADNDAARVRLDRPWDVIPDANSRFALVYGAIENLHVQNRLVDCSAYEGVYGAGIRNVWDSEILERMATGFRLWLIRRPSVMYLNVLRSCRLMERGSIAIVNERGDYHIRRHTQAPAVLAEYARLLKAFGNEVRGCAVVGAARFPGNEYAGSFWTQPAFAAGKGNAATPLIGREFAFAVAALPDVTACAADPDDRSLEAMSAGGRWNLFAGNLAARTPVGFELGKTIQSTVLWKNTTAEVATPVREH